MADLPVLWHGLYILPHPLVAGGQSIVTPGMTYISHNTYGKIKEHVMALKKESVGEDFKAVLESKAVLDVEQHTEVVHKPALKQQTEDEMLVDELVDLERKLIDKEVEKMLKRKAEIVEVLRAKAMDFTVNLSDQPVTFAGADGALAFTPCDNKRVITKKKEMLDFVSDKFGDEAVLAVINITVGNAEKVLGADEIAKFAETQPGARKSKIVFMDKKE